MAAVGVSLLVLRGSFRRVEHVLLALSAVSSPTSSPVFSPIRTGVRPRRAWVPACPGNGMRCWWRWRRSGRRWRRGGSPSSSPTRWTSACSQGPALRARDVIVGALMTGVIGLFVVIACAATLHAEGIRRSTTLAMRPRHSSPWPGASPRPSSASASSAPPLARRGANEAEAEEGRGQAAGQRLECPRGVAGVVDRRSLRVQGRGAGDDDEGADDPGQHGADDTSMRS